MTAVSPAPRSTAGRQVAIGSKGFIAILSLAMAVTALGVDTILPAYGDIRESLGLDPDSTEVTGLITFYLMGNSIGLLPAGLLADRFGRRAVMWGGLAIYVIGAVGSMLAPSLGLMLVARFVWGVGGAGPRVAALAVIRDGFAGEQMARQMSLVMAVFLLVPAVGPALSTGILAVGPWEWVVVMCAIAAVAVAFLVLRLPETLPVGARRPLAVGVVLQSYKAVFTAPGTLWYLASLTALFGAFISYLATSEIIMDQTYDLAAWFPVFFGGTALVMLVAMLLNGRVVERIGLRRLLTIVFGANITTGLVMLAITLATDGVPPFWLFALLLSSVLFTQQMLIPNVNSAAMLPLAAVAGTGAAVLNMVSGVAGSLISEIINQQFAGTVTPLAAGFVICSMVAAVAWRRADHLAADAADAAVRTGD